MHNTGKAQLNSRQLAINMISSIIAFCLNLFINFFITPYITAQFGADAYGFVKLANDFTNYASLASIALNSMASRFLMLARERGDIQGAQKYFSSIALANIVLSGILIIPSLLCILFLDRFLVIPQALVSEVKITFAVTFAIFLGNLSFSTYSNCYYLTNKLSIDSIRGALMTLIQVTVVILLFLVATPRISYIAYGSFAAALFSVLFNLHFTRKLLPEFRFRIEDFEWRRLQLVLAAGIWNSITKLSQIFSSGLDLMVTNLFIGSTEMGYLAVAKTVPNVIASFNATVANAFSPNMMALYAHGEKQALKDTAKTAMKFMCLFVTIPNAILITMGKEFFRLWVPTQPAELLCILSVLTIINSCVTGPLTPLYQLFTITNKVKQSSIILIIYGFCSILGTYICLKTTSLGLYAVAGVSLIGSLIVALCYHLPFAAIYIELPWYTFYPEVGKGILSLAVQCMIGYWIHSILPLNTWGTWFSGAILATLLGLTTNSFLILNKEERAILAEKVMVQIRRK